MNLIYFHKSISWSHASLKNRLLLTSIVMPFSEGRCTGAELFNVQICRYQNIFSPRVIHTQWSLDVIANNLNTPTVVLHYPSERKLRKELKKGYEYVGISFNNSIFPEMVRTSQIIRKASPKSKIILGGYGTILPDEVLKPYCDIICREEGISFVKRLLGEKNSKPFQMPFIKQTTKIISLPVSKTGVLVSGLGCPNGCDFCVTSHYWKRKYIPFLKSGYDIFEQIRRYVQDYDIHSIFIIDEEFLLNRKRVLEYLECIKKELHWDVHLYCFSSIKAVSQYSIKELVEMNMEMIWIGYEAKKAGYQKMQGRDTNDLINDLQRNGIAVLSSAIIGYDYQTMEVIEQEFSELMSTEPAFTQFLIYGPLYGTPLYERMKKEMRLLKGFDDPSRYRHKEMDGYSLGFEHPHFSPEEMSDVLEKLYKRDFEILGPSIFRMARVWLNGYLKFRTKKETFYQRRSKQLEKNLKRNYLLFYVGLIFAPSKTARKKIKKLKKDLKSTFTFSIKDNLISALLTLPALWTWVKLKLNIFQDPNFSRIEYNFFEKEDRIEAKVAFKPTEAFKN